MGVPARLGRRRVISVVEDVPVSPRTTTLMARRRGAEGGPEGRSFRKGLLTNERTELLLSWRYTGFSVHNRVRVESEDQPAQFVRRIAAYSNVSRGRRRKAGAEQGVALIPPPVSRDEIRTARALRRSWAQLIKRIYAVDPLVCPSCDSEMKVIVFITEHEVVDAILGHLANAEAKAPRGPPAAAPLATAS